MKYIGIIVTFIIYSLHLMKNYRYFGSLVHLFKIMSINKSLDCDYNFEKAKEKRY